MALISPILDDRTFEQLRDELVKRIPVYAPEWTNHNESDPGIALLELFAYLGESMLFRFNQIPDTTKIAFLNLLGVRRRTARPSQALVSASTEVAKGVQVLRATPATAGSVRFLTEDELYVWPLDSVAVGKVRVRSSAARGTAEHARRDSALAYQKLKASEADFYETQAVPVDPTHADAVPLDVSATLDQSLWVALLKKPTTDLEELRGRTLFVGVAFDETVPAPFALEDLPKAEVQTYRSRNLTEAPPPMLWQLWSPDGFTTLSVLGDRTQGLVQSGVVKLELPQQLAPITGKPAGGLDTPPPLADEKQQKLVVAWLRASRPKSSKDTIGRVRWVGLNTVSVEQSVAEGPELLGVGNGHGGQQFALAARPVLPRTMVLEVEEPDGWHEWEEVEDLTVSHVDDRHFVVDHSEGLVAFGSQRVPQIGQRIRVRSYRSGGGVAGNVGPRAISAFNGVSGGVKVANPLPATGGADAASLVDALDAIPGIVHRRDRVVVADDFSAMAENVAGVARAHTLPLMHPDTPHLDAAGVVSVVVFPREDFLRPDAPTPDHELLRRVARDLDARRLVTTELYVIPPTYLKVVASAGIHVRDGYQVDAVRRWVELILRQYLAPLPPYGPDGSGWPMGRAVRRTELEAVAVQVDGVEYIEDDLLLGVLEDDGSITEKSKVDLEKWQVPQLAEITVVAGPPLPLGDSYEPAPPPKVPVPLPPEVC